MNLKANASEQELKLRKNAILQISIGCGILVILGFLYYLFILTFHMAIPCGIYQLTGYKCPTCGITRMCLHIGQFRFREAIKDNAMVFFLWPFIVYDIICVIYKTLIHKKTPLHIYISSYIMVGIAVIFCIIRNIYKI